MGAKRVTTPRRTEIADAALRIIGERGITSLTTATLAAELGVSSGAPFRHFASLDELLEETAHRVVELVEASFPPPGLGPLERIQGLFLARTEVMGRNAGLARLIFSDQFAKALPERAAVGLRGVMHKTRAFLLDALEEAARERLIRRDLAPVDLLVPLMGTLQHVAFLLALPREGAARPMPQPDPRRVLATLMALLAPAGEPMI